MITNIFKTFFVFILALIASVTLVRGVNIYSVHSGSMSPKIPTGSLVIVKPQQEYKNGDIITFGSSKSSTTHRIVETAYRDNQVFYVTKGDANDGPDSQLIAKTSVIGKTIFHLPFIGFLTSFIKTKIGFILLVIIPALIIVFDETSNIKKELAKNKIL